MTVEDFVKNLSGVDGGKDFDGKLLRSIYKAIKKQQFIGGADHVVQTQHLQQRIVQSNNTSAGRYILLILNTLFLLIIKNLANEITLMVSFGF